MIALCLALVAGCQLLLRGEETERRGEDSPGASAGVSGSSSNAGAATSSSNGGVPGGVPSPDGGESVAGGGTGGERSGTPEAGAAGAEAAGPVSLQFRLPSKAEPRVASSEPSSVVIWRQFGEVDLELWSSALGQDGWSKPVRVDMFKAGHVEQAQLAMDAQGNAVAIWIQDWADESSVYVNRRRADGVWQGPQVIEFGNTPTEGPQIAIGSPEHVAAAWLQSDGEYRSVWVSRYESGAWTSPELIEQLEEHASSPKIAVAVNGEITVVWTVDSRPGSVWANRFSEGRWGTAKELDTSTDERPLVVALEVEVAASAAGNALTLWTDRSVELRGIHFSEGGWKAAEPIVETSGLAGSARVQMDAAGNALVVWSSMRDVGSKFGVRARSYSSAQRRWAVEQGIDTLAEDASNPALCMNDEGQAIAIWTSVVQSQYSVSINRFDGERWGLAQTVAKAPGLHEPSLDVAIDSAAKGMAVWLQADGESYTLMATRLLTLK